MNKKRYSFRKDNKGAALVSVLIAIAFISILASALLFMSFQNYKIKAVSGFSKNNFYEAESSLNTLTARVRNNLNAAGTSARSELENYCSDATCTTYDTEKLAKVVFPTASGHKAGNDYTITTVNNGRTENVTFTSGGGYAVTDESANGFDIFRFKGVKIKKEILDAQGNTLYSNNVKSDIVFVIKNITMADSSGGVGNCSMLFDAPLEMSTAEKTTVLGVYGNTFISNAVFTGSESVPGRYQDGDAALWIAKETKINVVGDYFVVYGDLVIDGSAALCLYGKSLTVYGDIILKDKGVLICNADSKIYMVKSKNLPGRPLDNRTGIYVWSGGNLVQSDAEIKKHVFPAGRAQSSAIEEIEYNNFEQFRQKLHFDDADAANDGIIPAMIQKTNINGTMVSYKDLRNCNNSGGWGNDIDFKGQMTGVKVNTQSDVNGSDFTNKLVFNICNQDVIIKDTSARATIISDTPVKLEQQHNIALSKIGDDIFEFMRIKSTDEDNDNYDARVHAYTNYQYMKNGSYMSANGHKLSPGDFFKDDCNQTVDLIMSFSVNGGGGSSLTYSSVSFENWIKDKE